MAPTSPAGTSKEDRRQRLRQLLLCNATCWGGSARQVLEVDNVGIVFVAAARDFFVGIVFPATVFATLVFFVFVLPAVSALLSVACPTAVARSKCEIASFARRAGLCGSR